MTLGLDLKDLYRGRMTFRRLGVILKHLPMDSATRTALRDAMSIEDWNEPEPDEPTYGPWGRTDYLLAQLIDVAQGFKWQASRSQSPPPEPYPRPGVGTYQPAPVKPEHAALAAAIEAAQGAHVTRD